MRVKEVCGFADAENDVARVFFERYAATVQSVGRHRVNGPPLAPEDQLRRGLSVYAPPARVLRGKE
jgi:hypothetical protein